MEIAITTDGRKARREAHRARDRQREESDDRRATRGQVHNAHRGRASSQARAAADGVVPEYRNPAEGFGPGPRRRRLGQHRADAFGHRDAEGSMRALIQMNAVDVAHGDAVRGVQKFATMAQCDRGQTFGETRGVGLRTIELVEIAGQSAYLRWREY